MSKSNFMLRELAISKGMTTFIGSPCRVCSNKVRRVSENTPCVECDRRRAREYRAKNKDACNARSKQWMIDNHEYRISYQKSRRVSSVA
jgi:hypothetical protein